MVKESVDVAKPTNLPKDKEKELNLKKGKDGKDAKKKDEMTEEDMKLKADLELVLERLEEPDEGLYGAALEQLRSTIRTSTTSVTSVPKPLKFLRPHFERIKKVQAKISDPSLKALCADVLSALAMTVKGSRDCLKYRLLGRQEDIGEWGQEYVKHVSDELGEEWKMMTESETMPAEEKKEKKIVLLALANIIVNFYLTHNSEVEACDLMMEIGEAERIPEFADDSTFGRIGLYLTSCVPYLPDPDNTNLLKTAKRLYLKFKREIEALRCAIMLNSMEEITGIFFGAKDLMTQKQMAILLGRHQIFLDITAEQSPHHEDLIALNSNSNLFAYFSTLARELDIMEPKLPEDIYKTHLEQTRGGMGGGSVDSAKKNLADTFVNGFLNSGFGSEKLMGDEPTKWFYKNKEFGMLSAAASVGLVYRWDVDTGLTKCDAHLYSPDDFIKAGSMLATGIISSGICHDADPAQALLADYVDSEKPILRIGAVFGLGLAYTNSKRQSVMTDVLPRLKNVLEDQKASSEIQGLAGLSIGLICVGTGNETYANAVLALLKKLTPEKLKDSNFRFLALSLALINLGRQNLAESWVKEAKALPSPFGPMTGTLVDVCAYAGTGNVLKIQEMLHICSEHHEHAKEEKKEKTGSNRAAAAAATAAGGPGKGEPSKPDLSLQQAVATLGIGLIAMGEDIGASMSSRVFGMLMRYGEPCIRRAVPLALGLISVSNPALSVLETLSKFSHDMDPDTANCAIFALGLAGAGTNNARLGNMLRQLAVFHQRDPQNLMMVRIAQGLTHMGKGTMTLSPYHSDRQLMCPASVAALLSTCFAFLDVRNTILGPKQHYLLYCLVPAMQPRHLLTFVEDTTNQSQLQQVNVSVRVGQAVDVVGQAGKPKGITGFQTQTTPVLLAHGERAELATEEYISLSPVLEGIVILKKNPDYEPKKKSEEKKKK